MPDDVNCRELLRSGDALCRVSDYEAAIREYLRAAAIYQNGGSALKAVAVLKTVRDVTQKHLPDRVAVDREVRVRLAGQYRVLGLISEATSIESESDERSNQPD